MSPAPWLALQRATAHDAAARVPFRVLDQGRAQHAGSVARTLLPTLARWPHALQVADDGVQLTTDAAGRDEALAHIHHTLHAECLLRGWRNETYALLALPQLALLACMERAAARLWGTLTFGAHCTGYVADARGRPTHLWIAERSPTKATDPGKLDNLIGGGVPLGQRPHEALVREAWEEAGLRPEQLRGLRPGRVLRVAHDVPEGFQHEWLHSYDLALPEGVQPCNQDGEVAALHCLPVGEALSLAAGDAMTVDAALVTLDFALRHQLLPPDVHAALLPQLLAQVVPEPQGLASARAAWCRPIQSI